jgi:lipopolysaccharide transport system permease protein
VIGIIRQVWRWRQLVWELARRDFKARYAGSVLGAAWAVLEPLVQFGLYLIVFSVFLGMRLERQASMGAFGVYIISGLVPFLAFQEAIMRATGLVRERAQMVRHVNVPLEAILAGALVAVFLRHCVALTLVLVASVGWGMFAIAKLPWLLAGVAVLAVGVFGLALGLVVAGAFVPDLSQVIGTVSTVLFFVTPIVYPATVVPRRVASLLVLNPLWGVVASFHTALSGQPPQGTSLLVAGVFAAGLLVSGALIFEARRRQVPDLA